MSAHEHSLVESINKELFHSHQHQQHRPQPAQPHVDHDDDHDDDNADDANGNAPGSAPGAAAAAATTSSPSPASSSSSSSSVPSSAPTPVFTLEAQRKFNAFNAGLVHRSALEVRREPPAYFKPKAPEKPGIVGVPFYTSFKAQSVSELQKERAKAAVQQMGDYHPPSQFNYRASSEELGNKARGGRQPTARAVQLEQQLRALEEELQQKAATLSATQRYGLKQRVAKTRAALVRESADFSCSFGTESIQALRRKTAVNQEGLFDEAALEPGDRVLVHFPGTSECWRGPFVVVRRINASLFTVRDEAGDAGQLDVETSRLQDMRIRAKPPSAQVTDKHFVRNVGRATARDAVLELARNNNAGRDPYQPPSSYEYVEYEPEQTIRERRDRARGRGASPLLDPLPAEKEAEARRARFNETQRKQAARGL
eukprot:INCI13462.10.p2 GENE.INCI13462.10~~INCI13462.10.p2  ORF type:complete len:453 (-),score=99.11 INCI13462.10:1934-3214(-)